MSEIKKEIAEPSSLSAEQINLAKAYVMEKHEKGISITEFLSKQGKSTKTWYEWINQNEVFSSYLTALGGSIISDDEREAYQIVKKKIMANATKNNATTKDIDLFLSNFAYVVEAEKQERMKQLGIQPAHEKRTETSVEERKASLLSRLRTNKPASKQPEGNEDNNAI
jgi:hypothetical protein